MDLPILNGKLDTDSGIKYLCRRKTVLAYGGSENPRHKEEYSDE